MDINLIFDLNTLGQIKNNICITYEVKDNLKKKMICTIRSRYIDLIYVLYNKKKLQFR